MRMQNERLSHRRKLFAKTSNTSSFETNNCLSATQQTGSHRVSFHLGPECDDEEELEEDNKENLSRRRGSAPSSLVLNQLNAEDSSLGRRLKIFVQPCQLSRAQLSEEHRRGSLPADLMNSNAEDFIFGHCHLRRHQIHPCLPLCIHNNNHNKSAANDTTRKRRMVKNLSKAGPAFCPQLHKGRRGSFPAIRLQLRSSGAAAASMKQPFQGISTSFDNSDVCKKDEQTKPDLVALTKYLGVRRGSLPNELLTN